MLRVCIDANVYISGLAFGGKPLRVLTLALNREFYLITSLHILTEVKRNLKEKLFFPETLVDELLGEYIQVSDIYDPEGKIKYIDHKQDNMVLETALLGSADVLVTGDKKDLLPLKVFQGIIIEPPSAFLRRLEESGTSFEDKVFDRD